jgi:hypothetical protein
MEIKIPVTPETKFKWLVEITSCMAPFNALRPREKEGIAKLLELHYKLKDIPKEQRGLLIFHKDNMKKMADEMSMTIDNFYNLKLELKKKGLVDDYGIIDKYCNPFMNDISNINFKFTQ